MRNLGLTLPMLSLLNFRHYRSQPCYSLPAQDIAVPVHRNTIDCHHLKKKDVLCI